MRATFQREMDFLERLAADTVRELRGRSFGLEDRPFVAHLTLGRVRDGAGGPELRAVAAAIDGLTVALKDPNPSVRRQAAFALGQIR